MINPSDFTILLVEDSMTIRYAYKNLLENHGFYVVEAEDGEGAWESVIEDEPDLVLLDLILPDISGLEVLERIRSFDNTKDLPVIILTNVKEIPDIQKAISLGANYYGYKGSSSPEKILKTIINILEKDSNS